MEGFIVPISDDRIIDNRYCLLEIIGSGSFSIVYKAMDLSNNQIYALKLMNKNAPIFKKEIEINKKIDQFNSPFFIKYIDSNTYDYLERNERELKEPYMVLELASKGSVINYIKYNGLGLNEKLSKYFFAKILQIVLSLHSMGICHKDLKLDKFLFVGDNFTLKLSDFGISSFIIKNSEGKVKKQKSLVRTPCYTAPEIFLYGDSKGYDGEKADIFSLGVILFSLRTCKSGFKRAKSDDPLYKFIKEGKIPQYWSVVGELIKTDGLTEEFKNLYIKMVSSNPKKRPTLEQIYNDEWLKEIRDLNEEQLKNYEKELIAELKSRE